MRIEHVTVGAFQENCYLVWEERSKRGVLVDPGGEGERIVAMVRRTSVSLDAIWLTHAHVDHVGAISPVRAAFDVPVLMHPDDQVLYDRAPEVAAMYGLDDFVAPPADRPRALGDGDVLRVGSLSFRVLHTPGHAPGHCVFVGDEAIFAGDLLFAGSIGRTDLPYCDAAAMSRSLARVSELTPALRVLPGHGPATTIGRELATNPFLSGDARPVRP